MPCLTKAEKLLIEFENLELDQSWPYWPVTKPIRFTETDVEFLQDLLKMFIDPENNKGVQQKALWAQPEIDTSYGDRNCNDV